MTLRVLVEALRRLVERSQRLEVVDSFGKDPEFFKGARVTLERYLRETEVEQVVRVRYRFEFTGGDKREPRYDFLVVPIGKGGFEAMSVYSQKPIRVYPTPKDALGEIPENTSLGYRGMSYEEYQSIQKTGGIQSKGAYNIGQEGLTFFGPSATAAGYAGGFAPWQFYPSREKPGVVIAVSRKHLLTPEQDSRIPGEELALKGMLAAKEIQGVWFLVPTEVKAGRLELIAGRDGRIREGSRASPSISTASFESGSTMSSLDFPILWPFDKQNTALAMTEHCPKHIPWALLIPHEAQALRNHNQTLQRLAERGGLAPCEALAILEDRRWRAMPLQNAIQQLKTCVTTFEKVADT